MIIRSLIEVLRNKNTMLADLTVEDLEDYKKNACKILKSHSHYATAKIVEELIDKEIATRNIIEKFNNFYDQFPVDAGARIMDIKYISGAYQVTILDLQYTIGCDNVMKCKQRFLDIMSKEFDKVVNEKLGDYGFYKENK